MCDSRLKNCCPQIVFSVLPINGPKVRLCIGRLLLQNYESRSRLVRPAKHRLAAGLELKDRL